MIDWLTIDVAIEHPELISGGKVASVREDGTIEWEIDKFKQVTGSHDATVSVKTKKVEDGKTSMITISGNPVKFLQGHNLFGSDDLRSLAFAFVMGVLEKLGIPSENTHVEFMMRNGLFLIKRIDCTHNFKLNSREEVRSWIRTATKFASGRHQKTSAYSEKTLYIGQNSRRVSLKIYCKGDEIIAHKLSDKIPLCVRNVLALYADKILRCEVTLRGKELKERKLEWGVFWTDKNQVYNIVMERIMAMKLPENIYLDSVRIEGLKPRQQMAYDSWKTGKDLRSVLKSKPTFYRYRSELLPYGIDIACPSGKERGEFEVPLKEVFNKPPIGVLEWLQNTIYAYDPPVIRGELDKRDV
ncbi:MAG: hypothetical protein A2270_01105 [Elusimicrobia bacterium RIFOXYA12_FULL_51_18]|nr:MAG: hypothetical protein A2270_01105 [Elusimicrobia bacterium RIFOXYA12_FULL_51_18]OGS31099.1 MAG: hypothetical protein A2218_02030 [Elusimicrobia bacterium RIFOXYA2_FULL_53_38]